jgi:drug/metabolite transporter (DMT)-like permease
MKNNGVVIICALIASICYGILNNTIETRLKSYSFIATVWVIDVACAIIGSFVILGHWSFGKKLEFPIDKNVILVAISVAVLYYVGSLLDVFAYTIGGRAFDISTIFVAIPITVGVIMVFSNRGLPNAYQIVAFLLVAIASVLFAVGSPTAD